MFFFIFGIFLLFHVNLKKIISSGMSAAENSRGSPEDDGPPQLPQRRGELLRLHRGLRLLRPRDAAQRAANLRRGCLGRGRGGSGRNGRHQQIGLGDTSQEQKNKLVYFARKLLTILFTNYETWCMNRRCP